MPAKRRIVVLAVASILASALASAAVDYKARRFQKRQAASRPTDVLVCEPPRTPQNAANQDACTFSGDLGSKEACSAGMIEISGDYCPAAEQICE